MDQWSCLTTNVCYPLRNGKNDPEGNSELNRADTITMVPEGTDLGCQGYLLVSGGELQPGTKGMGLPSWWAWRTEHQAKEDYCRALKSCGIFLATFLTSLG